MKKSLCLLLCLIMLFSLASCGQSNEDYTAKLISVMNEQEEITVKDIFSFEFERAYIFHQGDCYFDGETFTKTYNLDISIDKVENGMADYRLRSDGKYHCLNRARWRCNCLWKLGSQTRKRRKVISGLDLDYGYCHLPR